MNELTHLPNIGEFLAEQLKLSGISTPAQLIAIGSEDAFARVASLDDTACINMLYALEGAIQGIHWHQLTTERKMELLEFFQFLKKQINQ